jgi:glycosyltransferase involved in cell wall biosynthesis
LVEDAWVLDRNGTRSAVGGSRERSAPPYAGGRQPGSRSSQSGYELRIVVVGAGTRFLSGISYYTIRLANALAERYQAGVITMRQILPTRLYPGRGRVGATLTRLDYDPAVRKLAPVDWYWLPSLARAVIGLFRFRPDVVVFQWWTGTVLHTYLALALVARALGAKIIVEFHEILDTGEERIPFARHYVRLVGPLFVGLAAGFVIHSEADREPLVRRYRLGRRPCAVIPHGPYDHHVAMPIEGAEVRVRATPPQVVNLLFFGIIRPFKGLEDLVEAFDGLSDEEVQGYGLTVVGETWEGWDLPIRLIEASRHRARITLVNRYVDDAEVAQFFADADAVVLPYHRSSASGPAHVAMSHGLPLVITSVGGLPAAVEGYEGAILIPPRDPVALREAIRRLPAMLGRRFSDPHSWQRTVERYGELLARLEGRSGKG